MGFLDDIGFGLGGAGIPLVGLGLGLGQDIFGGLSAYNQQKQRQQVFNAAQLYNNPNYVTAQAQPYINQLNQTLAGQVPMLMRTQVNPMLGAQGIDPTSGAGQSIYANALAPYVQQNTQQGLQDALNAGQLALGMQTSNLPSVYGNMQGTQNALRDYAMYAMLANQNRQQGAGQSAQAGDTSPYGGLTGLEGVSQFAGAPGAQFGSSQYGYGAGPYTPPMFGGYPTDTFD